MQTTLDEILLRCQAHANYLTPFMATHKGIKDEFLARVKDAVWHFVGNENAHATSLYSALEFEIMQHTPNQMSWQHKHHPECIPLQSETK